MALEGSMKRAAWTSSLVVSLFVVAGFHRVPAARASEERGDPRADPAAVVVAGQARFTVLTPRLIRLEWAADGSFEDRPSLVFLNRRLPAPAFRQASSGGWTTIDTGELKLRYREGGGKFTAENLSLALSVSGKPVTWKPGDPETGNLLGTTRTLDGIKGATSLEPGLVSRDGWVVVDDSARPMFDDSPWPWVVERQKRDALDWYFFGHGHDYKAALGDFVKVAGRIPMPPRFAFGAWWSRYWSYTDQELMDLVREFEEHDVPLDVLVIDMDWHRTFGVKWWQSKLDQSGHRLGWTGYSWNRDLFPDPERFLAWCEARGLETPLNLHPASGVQPHEDAYPEMARAMGIDPSTQKYVPFDITNKKFAESYLSILHHPLERQGVDFWWIDWQQEQATKTEGVNPTFWLNYVHTSDMERRGLRPLIFHRWGGLGNHRYQIGFSGDTHSVWESLAFQPYFTATAANVGYAYWSHDIGGHMPGEVGPDLYTRWVQFGAFSPILRTHTTKNPRAERRIWAYPPEHAKAMRDAFLLRYALIPYIYTESRRTYDTGVAFFRPLYYDWPESPEAYRAESQYLFGDSMMVAPIVSSGDWILERTERSVWLPPGTWVEWFTGDVLEGPATLTRAFTLDQIPVYVKAGAIVPMQPRMRHTREKPVDPLIVTVFPGAAAGSIRVYEDEGDTLGYKSGAYAWTPVRQATLADGTVTVTVGPVEGTYPGMPAARGHEIRLVGTLPPRSVSWRGRAVPYVEEAAVATAPFWSFEGRTLTTVVGLPRTRSAETVEVSIAPMASGPEADGLTRGFAGRIARLEQAMRSLEQSWPRGWAPDALVRAVQTPRRLELAPERATEELRAFAQGMPRVVEAIREAEADASRAVQQLGDDAKRQP
jgi:alpha-glucosidase